MERGAHIEAAIYDLLGRRAGNTICPSDVARAIADDWRPLMDEVRAVAFRLADEGGLRVTQRGRDVNGRDARGPIRLKLP